jgi:hypothetical protein
LASQGFHTKRLNESPVKNQNPRLKEIKEFLEFLQNMTNDLRQKKMLVESILTKSESTLSSELEKI